MGKTYRGDQSSRSQSGYSERDRNRKHKKLLDSREADWFASSFGDVAQKTNEQNKKRRYTKGELED